LAVRVAYGKKHNVASAINDGVIPKESIILTSDEDASEILFYDKNGELKTYVERTRFETITEAELWVNKYPCTGCIFTIQNGAEWLPYIVQNDNSLTPFKGNVTDVTNVKRIDGGSAVGM